MMMLFSAILLAMNFQVAQAPAPSPAAEIVDTRGPCLDSAFSVPAVIGEPRATQSEIVRIDKVVSTSTYTPNEVIGFLYTRSDAKAFLGLRDQSYVSPASAKELNEVLASTHAPDVKETAFPPQTKLGVRTGNQSFFEVKMVPGALDALHIRLDPCVAWPAGRPLPDLAP